MVYFALIYLHALRKSRKKIRTMKIYDLIYFERQNEGAVISKGTRRRWVFAAALCRGTDIQIKNTVLRRTPIK